MREDYLKNQWQRYPSLTRDRSDESNEASGGLSHGRIEVIDFQKSTLKLGWAGQSVLWRLEKNFKLGFFSPNDDFVEHDVGGEVLVSGDIVRVKLTENRVVAVELLVPCQGIGKAISGMQMDRQARWQRYISSIRSFFKLHHFHEVETPFLVPSPGAEEHLHGFKAQLKIGKQVRELYLPTSPEFHLKKSLCMGYSKIFEIKSCFRNFEIGIHHQPEFTMLEWYRAFSNIEKIMDDVEQLVSYLHANGFAETAGRMEIRRFTVAEAFQRILDFPLRADTSRDDLMKCLQQLRIHFTADDSWDDLFFRLMIEKIEPELTKMGPLLLYNYPPTQAALARLNGEGWAKRFEFYWNGLEIANAFDELNDPLIQRQRLADTNRRRTRNGNEQLPVDEEFLASLDYGLPPSGGIALGVERLFMAMENVKSIQELKLFPHRESRD